MRRFLMSFRRQASGGGTIPPVTPDQPETPLVSDLVELGILTKQISEFSNDDIGTEVSIPYSNEGSGIIGPILFEVVGVNHHTSEEHPQTITLMTKNIIRKAAFDAMEPDNTNSYRRDFGNNRWSVSNIRQWLNSDGTAGKWWARPDENDKDEAPTEDKVVESSASENSYPTGSYADAPGFFAGFSNDVLQHLTIIPNVTLKPNKDGGGLETTYDKVFLPSYTEIGFGKFYGKDPEGTKLPKFTDDDLRKKKCRDTEGYWLRSPVYVDTGNVYMVDAWGQSFNTRANLGINGIAPIIVLH